MPHGYTIEVAERLWLLIEKIIKDGRKEKILTDLNYTKRGLSADIHKLNVSGLKITFSRKQQKYFIKFPLDDISLTLSPKEFFLIYYILNAKEKISGTKSLNEKLDHILLNVENSVYSIFPEEINSDTEIKKAITTKKKIVFSYDKEIRIIHPYQLVYTPTNKYLVGYCEEKNTFTDFELIKISQLKILSDNFSPKKFNIKKYLGDAWWFKWDKTRINNPYKIEILFSGAAEKIIQSYKFHFTQKIKKTKKGLHVEWKLSYLEEFAIWLMQWINQIKIIAPEELKKIISEKIKNAPVGKPEQ